MNATKEEWDRINRDPRLVPKKPEVTTPPREVDWISQEPEAPAPVGLKHDKGKPDWSLVPLAAVEQVAQVLAFGANKYVRDGWKHIEQPRHRYSAALMRHLAAWQSGIEKDPESGLPHIAHVAANALFLVWFDMQKK